MDIQANDPSDIFYYQPQKQAVDVGQLFRITHEGVKLRVKGKNINCLFNNLTAPSFGLLYNEYRKYLNLDFSPLLIENKQYVLDPTDQEFMEQQIITSIIYFYTINDLPVVVKRADLVHPHITDIVLSLLDKKLGRDTPQALSLGAHLIRMDAGEYRDTVTGRRRYYDR